MSGSATNLPFAQDVRVSDDELEVWLTDGRRIAVPLAWYPRLLQATPAQRQNWEILGDGEGHSLARHRRGPECRRASTGQPVSRDPAVANTPRTSLVASGRVGF